MMIGGRFSHLSNLTTADLTYSEPKTQTCKNRFSNAKMEEEERAWNSHSWRKNERLRVPKSIEGQLRKGDTKLKRSTNKSM